MESTLKDTQRKKKQSNLKGIQPKTFELILVYECKIAAC